MLLGKAIIVFVLGSITAAAAQVRPLKPASAPQSSVGPTSRSDQLAALRDDISKMRVLVQQMESNLAFVDTTQSPLKHQFQLEIDMWKTLIKQMERRLDAAEPR